MSVHKNNCDDDEDEESDDGADEADEESAYIITKSFRAVRTKNEITMDDNMAIIDTGPDKSCFKAALARQLIKVKNFGNKNKPFINLLNASA